MKDITWNKEQQLARQLIGSWATGESFKHILIEGTAGTGKTFTVAQTLKESGLSSFELAICAPTHKAKRVITEYLEDVGLDYDVYTVYSLLGLGQDIDDDGKRTFDKGSNDPPIYRYPFVWADECSMYPTDIFNGLCTSPAKLLFTGDRNQLLPIGEESFPVFDYFEKLFANKVSLVNPERYKGSIADFVYAALDCVKKERLFKPEKWIALDDHCTYTTKWFERWLKEDREKVVLTFSNNDVDIINEKCRDSVYGLGSPEYVEGEELLTYAPIKNREGQMMITNGTEVRVESIKSTKIAHFSSVFDAWEIQLIGYDEPIRTVKKKAQKDWDEHCNKIKKAAADRELRWYEYYACLEMSAQVKPTYALTIHKSQGSGYPVVYVVNSFQYLKDRSFQPRLHYVAASRAKELLIYSGRV